MVAVRGLALVLKLLKLPAGGAVSSQASQSLYVSLSQVTTSLVCVSRSVRSLHPQSVYRAQPGHYIPGLCIALS